MLQLIEQVITDPIQRLFCQWDAIDTETGAFLMRTNGRGKGGLPKFVLIKPNKSVKSAAACLPLTIGMTRIANSSAHGRFAKQSRSETSDWRGCR